MDLSQLDRAFLKDVATTNWLHHFIVAAGLKRTGAESAGDQRPTVLSSVVERHNLSRNLALFDRDPLVLDDELAAKAQSLAMIRLFQERVAALETLGILLLALSQRDRLGVFKTYFTHRPGKVESLFRGVARSQENSLCVVARWPAIDLILTAENFPGRSRFERLVPKLESWVHQAAEAYVRPQNLSLGTLGHLSPGYDPRGSVFVIVGEEVVWKDTPDVRSSLIVKAYNKVKHGFNATTEFRAYEAAASSGATAIVLEIPKSQEVADQFGKDIDLSGVLCRELARMTLELDDFNLLNAVADKA